MHNIGFSSVVRRHRPRGETARDVVRMLNTRTGIIVDKYLASVFEEQGFEFNPERDNRSVYSPEQLFDALSHYERREVNADKEALSIAMKITMKAFGGDGSLAVAELASSLKQFIKLEKSSGLPLAETKGAAFEKDLTLAQNILREDRAFPACIAYHRTQFGKTGPKTRLVWGYPLSATLVEAMFARPLIDHFLGVMSPMAFGYRKMELSAVTQRLRNCGLTYCLDYSKFDSSISARFIYFAFDVMRSHFGEFTEEEATAWKRIVNYFVHTTILMPDGYIYQKHGGVPSGSYFTQLVDSIVNFMATQYIALRATRTAIPNGWLFVLGDDSIFTLPTYVGMSDIKRYGAELGLKINVEKSVVARKSNEVHFLGHYWPHGVASRPLEELQLRLITSERPSRDTLPTQRGNKLFAFTGDCKEGSILASQLQEAQLRRWRYHKALYFEAVSKGSNWNTSTGHMRNLAAVGIDLPESHKFRKIGLWL